MMKLSSISDFKSLSQDAYPNFKIITDEADEIILEFDTHTGSKKATLSFLMAIFFKHISKAIKAEIGVKPTEMSVAFEDDVKVTDAMKAMFVKATNLLNLKLTFV